MPTIVALVKHVPDTWSTKSLNDDHTLDRTSVDNVIDEVNEYSVEQALRLRDNNPDAGYKVVALTMGPAQADEALRKALAMGADDAVLVSDDSLAGADALSTAWTLNAALNKLGDVPVDVDLVRSQLIERDAQTMNRFSKDIQVNYKTETLEFRLDEATTPRSAVEDMIRKLGYGVAPLA